MANDVWDERRRCLIRPKHRSAAVRSVASALTAVAAAHVAADIERPSCEQLG